MKNVTFSWENIHNLHLFLLLSCLLFLRRKHTHNSVYFRDCKYILDIVFSERNLSVSDVQQNGEKKWRKKRSKKERNVHSCDRQIAWSKMSLLLLPFRGDKIAFSSFTLDSIFHHSFFFLQALPILILEYNAIMRRTFFKP